MKIRQNAVKNYFLKQIPGEHAPGPPSLLWLLSDPSGARVMRAHLIVKMIIYIRKFSPSPLAQNPVSAPAYPWGYSFITLLIDSFTPTTAVISISVILP